MSSSSPILSPVEKLDKISQLPDDILLTVLSKLDFKNAVQTSMVEKRCRYLWTWLTVLDFDPEILSIDTSFLAKPDKVRGQGYLNWVNQIVDAHRGPCISKFRVFFDSQWSKDISQIEKWFRFALSKRVEELVLELRCISNPSFLEIDLLKHPLCKSGIVYLKSLYLSRVDVSEATLEFILLQCRLLERLHVDESESLHTLNIVSDKLKHLSLMSCINLEELVIAAVNLISFRFKDYYCTGVKHMVFKSVPKLVEVDFDGKFIFYPFPIFKQLTKLSLSSSMVNHNIRIPMEIDMLFPNVRELSLMVFPLRRIPFVNIKYFMNACPMLHGLKLQAGLDSVMYKGLAEQRQKYRFNKERNDEMTTDQILQSDSQRENTVKYVEREENENNRSHLNLKVVEVVGFYGFDEAVECVLHIIAGASSFETLIWDPRHREDIGTLRGYKDVEKTDTVKRHARRLAKLLPTNVRVGVRDKPGLYWVS